MFLVLQGLITVPRLVQIEPVVRKEAERGLWNRGNGRRRHACVPLVAVEKVREPAAVRLAVNCRVDGRVGQVEGDGAPRILVRRRGEIPECVVFEAQSPGEVVQ